MEDAQPAQSGNSGKSKLLRYALRSGTKSKEEKPPAAAADSSNSSASRRGRPASSVSKSVGVLDLSGKDKPAKPPRRLSIPAKSAASPAPKPVGNITPISEARVKRSATSQGKSETPVSDVSRSSGRKKYSVLSSASYWVSQIKYSEDAAKHSISLGFFKLALDAGCEPLQLMRDNLKSYARRHNLSEYGEAVKELFESYNIVENTEQLQVSETCSQVPEEGTRSSDDEIRSSSSSVGATKKLKPKSLNTDAAQVSPVTESAKKDTKRNTPATRSRGTLTKNNANSRSVSETGSRKSVKKTKNPSKQEFNKVKDITKKKGRKLAGEQGSVSPPAEIAPQENKENMEASSMEEISLNEAVKTILH